jgi:predicted NBD/HSP70 family sugar kinase
VVGFSVTLPTFGAALVHPLQHSALLRQVNGQTVMSLIIRDRPVTRVELARRSGLSKQTVSEIVRQLEAGGWVRETGRVEGRVGRSPIAYELNPRSGFVIGVDLGGTRLRAAIGDLGGTLLGEVAVPTEPRGGRDLIRQICGTARGLAEAEQVSWCSVQCVAIGTPGVLDPRSGGLSLAANIPGIGEVHVQEELADELAVPVLLDNDVNMAVLGEHWQGLGRGMTDFVFVAVGSGVGMGLVVDGQIRRGAHGAAGEICYLPLGADPYDEANQVRGPFEEAAAGRGILRRYAEAGGTAADVPEVFAAAAAGDQAARDVIEEEGRLLALAIAGVASVLDPQLAVLGGGIGAREEILPPVQRWLARLMRDPVEVRTTLLGHRASLVGALAVALRTAHQSLFGAATTPQLSLPEPQAVG